MIIGARPKLRNFSTISSNIVCDGNSLTAGQNASSSATKYPAVLPNYWPLAGSGQTVANCGQSGFTTPQLTASTMAPSSYVAGKKNILIFWEITNDVYNSGASAEQAIAHMKTYAAAVQASKAWCRKVAVTAIPRSKSLAASNAVLDAVNASLLANYRALGFDLVVDLRAPGSPFAFADYTDASFNAVASYYASDFVHLTDLGYAWVARRIASQLSRLAA